MMLGNFRKGIPGPGLNLVAGTIPLDIFIQREAILSSIQIQDKFQHNWDGLSLQKQIKGLIKYLTNTFNLSQVHKSNLNRVIKQPIWNKFTIDTESY